MFGDISLFFCLFLSKGQLLRLHVGLHGQCGLAPPRLGQLLTHCILMDSSPVICWTSLFANLGVLGLFCHIFYF